MLPLSITEKAIERLKQASKMHPEMPYVRLGIKGGGGCGGVMYNLGLDKATDKDKVYKHNDLKFVIEKGHLMHLAGLEVDFHENETDKGFVFNKEE